MVVHLRPATLLSLTCCGKEIYTSNVNFGHTLSQVNNLDNIGTAFNSFAEFDHSCKSFVLIYCTHMI